jgi:hypothetical protein
MLPLHSVCELRKKNLQKASKTISLFTIIPAVVPTATALATVRILVALSPPYAPQQKFFARRQLDKLRPGKYLWNWNRPCHLQKNR